MLYWMRDFQLANVTLHDCFATEPVEAHGPGLVCDAAQHFMAAVAAAIPPGPNAPPCLDTLMQLAAWLNCELLATVAKDISEALPTPSAAAARP